MCEALVGSESHCSQVPKHMPLEHGGNSFPSILADLEAPALAKADVSI